MRHSTALLVAGLGLAVPIAAQTWSSELPRPRQYQNLLYDGARHVTTLLGSTGNVIDPDDFVWTWNGSRWQQHRCAHTPNTTALAAVYDAGRQRIVAFGNRTFEYDGLDWSEVVTAHAPIPRDGPGIAYDAARQRTVLFGGGSIYGMLYDTWEYDGVDWYPAGGPNPPPVRRWGSCGYDPIRQRTVLFGGQGPGANPYVTVPLYDTWEYDGTHWTQRQPASHPSYAGQMLWEPQRQRLTIIDGNTAFEFDGSNWTPRPLASRPFTTASLTYDEQRQCFVQVGHYLPQFSNSVNEVLEYGGTAWEQRCFGPADGSRALLASDLSGNRCLLVSGASTQVRTDAGWPLVTAATPTLAGPLLTHDATHGRFLLFGGQWSGSYPQLLSTTHALVGNAWQLLPTSHVPQARTDAAMAFDVARGRAVLFGGALSSSLGADTWEFDGVDWQQSPTPVAPSARRRHAMAYDAALGAVVLFGGDDTTLTPLPDTWLYDGSGWQQRFTPHAPYGVRDHAMAFDPWRGRTVLHGGDDGYGANPSAETWEFDGVDWTQLATAGPPQPRRFHALTFDPQRGTMVLCGGNEQGYNSSIPVAPNTWDLTPADVPTWTRYGAGCAGSNGTPTLDVPPGALPQLGSTLSLQFANLPTSPGLVWLASGFGIDRWNGLPLPFDLASAGLPGCRLWIAANGSGGALVAHPGQFGSYALHVPAAPALAGVHLALQAFVLDPTQPSGAAVTNAGLAILH